MEHEGRDPATTESPLRCRRLALKIDRDQLNVFFPMLQRGVLVQAEIGCTLRELLVKQFGIPADYLADRITTLFLDNRPVDDLDRAVIHEGARVTLSAAMPGLVGATMRRSGFYAALRQGISYLEEAGEAQGGQGTLRLKLFNLLLPELAPLVLARGILMQKDDLDSLMKELSSASRFGLASSYVCEREECGGTLVTVSIRE